MIDKLDREERRRAQRDGVATLEACGALDDLYARIDAGEVRLEGRDGLIQQLIKAGLERGLQAELADHLGYDKGDADASMFPNSRNGSYPKTVATSVGDVDLAIPRDRDGSFTPMLVPKGSRRLSGLDDMIISLYAGGMTVRDIEHHVIDTKSGCRLLLDLRRRPLFDAPLQRRQRLRALAQHELPNREHGR